uniref:Uncharacterized protein n=1 Tax=Glossina pallidipes TaxID=7398 RepID=A0A1B0ADL7_GLOPL
MCISVVNGIELYQVDDQVNQMFTKIFRVVGPAVLRTAIQGNLGNQARTSIVNSDSSTSNDNTDDNNSNSIRVSVELPSFDPEDDDNNDESDNSNNTSTTMNTNAMNTAPMDSTQPAKQM